MKNKFLLTLLMAMLLGSGTTAAYDFMVGGFAFNITGANTAEVTFEQRLFLTL